MYIHKVTTDIGTKFRRKQLLSQCRYIGAYQIQRFDRKLFEIQPNLAEYLLDRFMCLLLLVFCQSWNNKFQSSNDRERMPLVTFTPSLAQTRLKPLFSILRRNKENLCAFVVQ